MSTDFGFFSFAVSVCTKRERLRVEIEGVIFFYFFFKFFFTPVVCILS